MNSRLIFRSFWSVKVINHNSSVMASSQPLAAICQLTSTADKGRNFELAQELILGAASAGASMIFLPEGFDYIAESRDQSILLSESIQGETIYKFQKLAAKLNVWLSLGGFHQMVKGEKLMNSHVIINKNGEIAAVYSKLHLFDVNIKSKEKSVQLMESAHTVAGRDIISPITTPIGNVGLAICYDIRFPQMALVLRSMGAEILTYPSAFTVTTGQAHWEILLRNKAIENQCFVIAAAQCGQHNPKRASFGHSMIVDPFGRIIASCKDEPGFALAAINLEYLRTVRQEMPVEQHCRNDIYGTLHLRSHKLSLHGLDFLFGCKTIKASQVFYRSNYSVGFVNIKPVTPGHVLVAPIRVLKRLSELTFIELADLFFCVQKIQMAVEIQNDAKSSTIAIQDGSDAGQTIKVS